MRSTRSSVRSVDASQASSSTNVSTDRSSVRCHALTPSSSSTRAITPLIANSAAPVAVSAYPSLGDRFTIDAPFKRA